MELSLFLAKTIGLSLTLISASMLLNRKNIDLLFEAYRSASAVYITGILETFLGIALILSHNVWTLDFRVVITLIGWMLLARGAGRAFFPSHIPQLLHGFKTMEALFSPLLIAIFVLGAYLAYMGFTS